MTNENDNDQCTNNQLNKEKDRMDCPYRFLFGYWLLSLSLVIGIWSIGNYPQPVSSRPLYVLSDPSGSIYTEKNETGYGSSVMGNRYGLRVFPITHHPLPVSSLPVSSLPVSSLPVSSSLVSPGGL
jgi:hypothetical protein